MNFEQAEIDAVLSTVAGILHLGNIKITGDDTR